MLLRVSRKKVYYIHVKWKSNNKTNVLHNLFMLLKRLERENYVVDVWLHIDHVFFNVLK